jgi:hypothetical protein
MRIQYAGSVPSQTANIGNRLRFWSHMPAYNHNNYIGVALAAYAPKSSKVLN